MQKVRLQIVLKRFLWLKKVKNTVPLTYVYNDFYGKEFAGTFYEKEWWKKSKELRFENIINRKGAKIYVIWKGYDGLFNSWINKKDSVWMSISQIRNF